MQISEPFAALLVHIFSHVFDAFASARNRTRMLDGLIALKTRAFRSHVLEMALLCT
jgi:hypothetical protein